MTQVSGGLKSPSMIPTAKAKGRRERGEPEFPPLPPPWTPVPNLPPFPQSGDSFCPKPIVREGAKGRVGSWQGRLRPLPQLASGGGGPRDAASLPLRVGPSHLGSAWRPGLCSAPPAPGPAQPAPRATGPQPLCPQPGAQACGWARGGGPCAPHTRPRSPSPAASRALGGARSPGPSAPRLPAGPPPPPGSRGRGRLPFPTITPTDSCPHPLGHQYQRRLPQPRTYLHGSTKPRSGGGESSALLCLSLALQGNIGSAIG